MMRLFGWSTKNTLPARSRVGPSVKAKPPESFSRVAPGAAPGATLEKLSGGFAFTEGPTRDRAGNVFFVDQPNNRIMEWSTDGKLSTFLQPSGYANGMCFDAGGNLIACADEHNQLWSIALDKTVTVLVTNYQGKYMNGPNDVWIAPNGGMFLTDPFYKRAWWDHQTMALTSEEVFYL